MSRAFAHFGASLVAALACLPAPLFAQGYESPPTFSAAQVLPPDLLQGPYHQIVGPVTVQGFLNRYQMQTKYGTFTVEGTELLRMRVREVAATAAFLASEKAGAITGTFINVTSGMFPS